MCKCVKEPVNRGAFVREGTCPKGHLSGGLYPGGRLCPDTTNRVSEFFSRLVSGIQEKYLGNVWSEMS